MSSMHHVVCSMGITPATIHTTYYILPTTPTEGSN